MFNTRKFASNEHVLQTHKSLLGYTFEVLILSHGTTIPAIFHTNNDQTLLIPSNETDNFYSYSQLIPRRYSQ